MTLEQLNMLKLVAEQGSLKKPVNLYIKLNRLLAKDKQLEQQLNYHALKLNNKHLGSVATALWNNLKEQQGSLNSL